MATTGTALPHDSGVFVDVERARMCNNHRPGTRRPRQNRSAAVRHGSRAHLNGGESLLTSSSRNRTDLDAEPDRSRRQELSVREAPEAAAFLVVAFLRVVVLPVAADFLVVDFLAVVFLAVVLRVARFLAGPLARFSASSS